MLALEASANASGSISALNDAGFTSLMMTSTSSKKKGQSLTFAVCSADFVISVLHLFGRIAQTDNSADTKMILSAPPPEHWSPMQGPGVDRIDPLHFLAGCCKRRLNQALSVRS